ncbi:MAG TPA: HD domain-containing phosphohydrolase [Gemmatimonadales bacterium]|nr:HD domain-containing phosphohydrolase [Gemmatimonadales bacterium]
MSAVAERWMYAFGQAMSAHALYAEGHQARQEAGTRLHTALEELLRADPLPAFTFLDETVIYGAVPLHGLREWTWGRRLAAAGVRRIELSREATPESLRRFLGDLHSRLAGEGNEPAVLSWPGIAAGDVAVRTGTDARDQPDRSGITLTEEVSAVRDAFRRVAAGGRLPVEDIEAVVHALAFALHSEGELLIPLLALRSLDDHTALHAVNTAILAMTFSEWLGLAGGDIRMVGKAALLHDIGMTRVPPEVFRDPGLSGSARARVTRHPEEGARLLLGGSARLDLAATAAYEHHLRFDGTGYPARRFHEDLHYISRIVSVCGAYDALRSERSYRPARGPEAALAEIEAGAGTVFDPGVARAFVQMMRRWERRLVAARLGSATA